MYKQNKRGLWTDPCCTTDVNQQWSYFKSSKISTKWLLYFQQTFVMPIAPETCFYVHFLFLKKLIFRYLWCLEQTSQIARLGPLHLEVLFYVLFVSLFFTPQLAWHWTFQVKIALNVGGTCLKCHVPLRVRGTWIALHRVSQQFVYCVRLATAIPVVCAIVIWNK